jgi:hypothetical protein
MKKLWLLVGFMGSVFVSAGAPSGAASPRGEGFHGRFVGHHGGPAFRMTPGARGDFRFQQMRFLSQCGHRFFVPQVIWPVYWYPSYNSDYYPFDSSNLDDGPSYGYADSGTPAPSAYSRGTVDQRPIVIVVGQGNSRPTNNSTAEYPNRNYGWVAPEGQPRLMHNSSEQIAEPPPLSVSPVIKDPAPAAKDPPAAGPAAPEIRPAQTGAVDKLVLVSWLKEDGKDVIYVQNTQTNDVQKITSEPNLDHFRIVEVHPNSDPRQFEAVISNGSDQIPVRFHF